MPKNVYHQKKLNNICAKNQKFEKKAQKLSLFLLETGCIDKNLRSILEMECQFVMRFNRCQVDTVFMPICRKIEEKTI